MNGRPTGTTPKRSGAGFLWMLGIAGCVSVFANVSRCTPVTPTSDAAKIVSTDPAIKSLNAAVAAQPLPALQPLSSAGVTKGTANMRKALNSEGLPGAMIFSQNCYDALSHSFGWRLLDICGSADFAATSSIPEDEASGMDKEIAYFQSEIAAARYLGAATGAGASTNVADERLAKLQARVEARKQIGGHSAEGENTSAATNPSDATDDGTAINAT